MASYVASLPALGLPLLTSPLTTLSTSLNVLLLNLTYTSLTLSYSPLRVEFILTLAATVLFSLVPSLLSLLVLNFFPSYALRSTKPYISSKSSSARNTQIATDALLVLTNTLLPAALQLAIEFFLTEIFALPSALRLPRTLPLPSAVVIDILLAYVFRGIMVYNTHRWVLHDKRGGDSVDWHWQYVHERWGRRVTPLLPLLEHPVNSMLVKWLPVYLPCALLRSHMLTYIIFLSLTSLETAASHSFLKYPSLIFKLFPFLSWSPMHLFAVKPRVERHYESRGRCAYEPWGIMDWFMGTSGDGEGEEGAKRRAGEAVGTWNRTSNGKSSKGKKSE